MWMDLNSVLKSFHFEQRNVVFFFFIKFDMVIWSMALSVGNSGWDILMENFMNRGDKASLVGFRIVQRTLPS